MNFRNAGAALLTALVAAGFTSCSNDDGPNGPALQNDYFTIDNGVFCEGAQPEGTESLDGVSYNNQALAGGLNYIMVSSAVEYAKFYVGIDGCEGYYEVDANDQSTTGVHVYNIPMMYSTNLNKDHDILLSALQIDGNLTATVKKPVKFLESIAGDLAINLTFSNDKDVDLHLICPNGQRIYFGNRGGVLVDDDNNSVCEFGLDHDSNPGCSIDGLNNENIVLPELFVLNGEYTVIVDMYENCKKSIATDWAIVARYKGNVIPVSYGSNPAYGTYRVNAPNGDHTVVMKFTINDGVDNWPENIMSRSTENYNDAINNALNASGIVNINGNKFNFRSLKLSDAETGKVKNHFNKIMD
ncbi:MAG: hypothetical protein NC204_02935 [Candidatus Amulumruptor caecigallinarius]|nr:hypothetical protein [Candidatus Amulumruptor caecigallinarius]